MVARSLARKGYRVHAVGSAEEALGLLTGPERIDLVLTDLGLPGMSGTALAERIARAHPGVRVLVTTGHIGGAASGGGEWDDSLPLLQKPFTPEALLQRIRSELDR
jgi:CheY-like chemotaxis protein